MILKYDLIDCNMGQLTGSDMKNGLYQSHRKLTVVFENFALALCNAVIPACMNLVSSTKQALPTCHGICTNDRAIKRMSKSSTIYIKIID